MRPKVYVAGPISQGNREQNVNNAMIAAAELIRRGYAPLVPQLTHYMDPAGLLPHSTWMEVDLPWVAVADCVLRLPGPSRGADLEVEFAKERSIRIVHAISALADRSDP